MSLPTRKIGTTQVTSLGFGLMGLSAFYGKVAPDEERLNFLDAVYARGCTFWDTSDAYGDSEILLGNWFKKTGKRNDIFLATKFGLGHSERDERLVKASPEYTHEAFNNSLNRLGVDHVDLYYLHRADPTVPIELTVREMAKLVKAGKVKYLGLSECSADTLRRAHAVHPISALQVEYSPFTLDIEDEKVGLLKTARELGITIVAYAPLGRGLLTGRFKSPDDFEPNDWRRSVARYSKENFPNILKIADGLKRVGARKNATAGQVALAWVLAQGDNIIPLAGTTKVENLDENLGAFKIHLTPEDNEEIRTIARLADAARGDRYPPAMARILFTDTPPLDE